MTFGITFVIHISYDKLQYRHKLTNKLDYAVTTRYSLKYVCVFQTNTFYYHVSSAKRVFFSVTFPKLTVYFTVKYV